MTQVRSESAPTGVVKEPLLRLQEALRKYVLQVIAQVEEDDPASVQLADELLAPLSEWQSRAAKPATPQDPALAEPTAPDPA